MSETEIKSVGMPIPSRQEWLKARRSLVGASEVAALFDLSAYGTTIQDLYYEKSLPERLVQEVTSPDMERGRWLEPIILLLYAQQSGKELVPSRLYVHQDENGMGATPDAEVVGGDQETVEVKSVRAKKFGYLKYNGLSDAWILQAQQQLEVCDRPRAIFVFQSPELWETVAFEIERDREIGAALRAKVREFWSYVNRGIVPTTAFDTADLPTVVAPRGVITTRNDLAWSDAVLRYSERKAMLDEAEELVAASKTLIKELIGGYGSCQGSGIRVHYKQRDGRETFDHKTMASVQPLDRIATAANILEAIAETLPESNEQRILLIERVLGALQRSGLDLAQFAKKGEPYDDMRLYVLKQDAEETQMLAKPKLRLAKGSE